ncbi:MAG TPA: globin domain-containing protein [Acidimicrobiales bacterium]|jgi:hemoglobin-like flavoprotein|nr:globin domain-containing protein [Acidimicrobiales bacterium]
MTPEQITLVQDSFRRVAAHSDALAVDFYARLFTADPSARALFTTDMAAQRSKFLRELEEIIRTIENFDVFLAHLADLGARHAGYGVRPVHYRIFADCLLAALAAAEGDQWTPLLEAAWSSAHDLVAEAMILGANDAARS